MGARARALILLLAVAATSGGCYTARMQRMEQSLGTLQTKADTDSVALSDMRRDLGEQKEILLMTHIVLGYPNFDTSLRLVEAMVESGVELMELQIPFSEPIAKLRIEVTDKYNDILKSQQSALVDLSTSLQTRLRNWAHPNTKLRLE